MDVLITVPELKAALQSERPPVLLDVRWELGGPPGRDEYLGGHLPGAVFVPLDEELAAHGQPTDGRHPLPSPEDFEAAARRWGINPGDLVVAYDDNSNLAASRVWWLLRWAGFDNVRLLDGALAAWVAAGGELVTDDVQPSPGTVDLASEQLPTVDLTSVAAFSGVLLDARAAGRYSGEVEPIDPKAGHIPGAVSAPTTENLAADGRFLTSGELGAKFAGLGVDDETPVAVYCGSGVTAAHEIAALAIAGINATLYPGSWSQWSNHDLPVATTTNGGTK